MAGETICIWTPQGLKCSASPVKSHNPGRVPCVPNDPGARADVVRRKAQTQAALDYWMSRNWANPNWSRLGRKMPRTPAFRRAREIARVIELLYAGRVEFDTRFTIVKAPR